MMLLNLIFYYPPIVTKTLVHIRFFLQSFQIEQFLPFTAAYHAISLRSASGICHSMVATFMALWTLFGVQYHIGIYYNYNNASIANVSLVVRKWDF